VYCRDKLLYERDYLLRFVAQIKPDIKSDLIVSAPCGMELLAEITDIERQMTELYYEYNKGDE
jgi:hypothetical protein